MVTARVAAENRIQSFCVGADDYIAKPYTPDQIFQTVEVALRWLDQSRAGQIQGEVTFDHTDDGEILRRLGQLRSLIFARTALGLEETMQIGRAVKEIWCLADEWAEGYPDDPITTLVYTLTDDRLTLVFRDAAGWFGQVVALADNPANSLYQAGFDQISIDDDRRLGHAEEGSPSAVTAAHVLTRSGLHDRARDSGTDRARGRALPRRPERGPRPATLRPGMGSAGPAEAGPSPWSGLEPGWRDRLIDAR